eukprot:5678887-Prymnesium_polylepis.2
MVCVCSTCQRRARLAPARTCLPSRHRSRARPRTRPASPRQPSPGTAQSHCRHLRHRRHRCCPHCRPHLRSHQKRPPPPPHRSHPRQGHAAAQCPAPPSRPVSTSSRATAVAAELRAASAVAAAAAEWAPGSPTPGPPAPAPPRRWVPLQSPVAQSCAPPSPPSPPPSRR